MYPLAVCSFLALFISLERILILRKTNLASQKHFNEWKEWLTHFKIDSPVPDSGGSSILTRILEPILCYLPLPHNRLNERLSDLARNQKHRLERGLVYLDTIAGIAPLFGLLGTALGMVEVFSQLAAMKEAQMSALSSGIGQALFTTVTGLFVGIPTLIMFNLLSRHVDDILMTTEEQINLLIDEFGIIMIREDPITKKR